MSSVDAARSIGVRSGGAPRPSATTPCSCRILAPRARISARRRAATVSLNPAIAGVAAEHAVVHVPRLQGAWERRPCLGDRRSRSDGNVQLRGRVTEDDFVAIRAPRAMPRFPRRPRCCHRSRSTFVPGGFPRPSKTASANSCCRFMPRAAPRPSSPHDSAGRWLRGYALKYAI